MAKVVAPIVARVEVVGRPKQSSYEQGTYYYPTLFIDLGQPEGSEQAKIWKNLSGDEVSQLRKGDRVQLVPAGQDKSGKAKHNIVILDDSLNLPPVSTTSPKATGEMGPDTKRAIAAFVDQQGDLLKFCWSTAKSKLVDVTQDEQSIQAAATTPFLAASRKFGLDR